MADAKTKTISGLQFEITQPYAPGHVINEAEARVLNQTRSENIGNNVRKALDALKDEDGSITKANMKKAEEIVADADKEYVFTLSNVGTSRVTDPLEREIRSLAVSVVNANIKDAGKTIKEYKAQEGGEERYEQLVEQVMGMEAVIARAKESLAAKQSLTGIKL